MVKPTTCWGSEENGICRQKLSMVKQRKKGGFCEDNFSSPKNGGHVYRPKQWICSINKIWDIQVGGSNRDIIQAWSITLGPIPTISPYFFQAEFQQFLCNHPIAMNCYICFSYTFGLSPNRSIDIHGIYTHAIMLLLHLIFNILYPWYQHHMFVLFNN